MIDADSLHSEPYPLPHRVLAFFYDEQRASAADVNFTRAAQGRFSHRYAASSSDSMRGCGEGAMVPLLSYHPNRSSAFELVD